MTVTREVEWDETEQALMLALAAYRAQCCPSGHYLPEAANANDEFAFEADANRCHMCTAVSMRADSLMRNPHWTAYVYRVRRKAG